MCVCACECVYVTYLTKRYVGVYVCAYVYGICACECVYVHILDRKVRRCVRAFVCICVCVRVCVCQILDQKVC